MDIKAFEEEQARLLQDPEIAAGWAEYQSRFPYVNSYFRGSSQYINQNSVVNSKQVGTDINLYKLFAEQCYNLLCEEGECGIVLPSGIYTDIGSTQLRQMLFSQSEITGLFCFENRKGIFENVDSRFKFVILTFKRGGNTDQFTAAFMRHDVEELDAFPKTGGIVIPIELVRQFSPDTISIMEFKNVLDIHIAEKMLSFPLLGDTKQGKWNVDMSREFHMTDDSYLYYKNRKDDMLPLYEGKMINQ